MGPSGRRHRSGARAAGLLLLVLAILLALGSAGASSSAAAGAKPKSRCCWVVLLDSAGSTTTDYGPKFPDPPTSPAAVAGSVTESWSFSVRMIEGLKPSYGRWRFIEPPSAVEAISNSWSEVSSVYEATNGPKGPAWMTTPACSPAASVPQQPFRAAEPYQLGLGLYGNLGPGGYFGLGVNPKFGAQCGFAESLSQHSCTAGEQKPGCYDFHQAQFLAIVRLGSVKPFLAEESVSRTCSESFSHPFPGSGPLKHSFNAYVTSTMRFLYFPAPELLSKDKRIKAEITDETKPKVPASVKPPGAFSSNPPQSSPYACSG